MNLSRIFTAVLALWAGLSASAKIITKPVAYEHAGVKLEGYLAYDDARISAGKKAPGVLVVPEWWGLNDYAKGRAQQLAKLGYVAFATDMYGAGVVTTDPKKAGEFAGQFYGKPLMAERAQAGLDQLLASGLVETGRVADAVLVPAEAVFVETDGPVAYRREGDGWERVRLEVGQRSDVAIEVMSGLAPGDEVSRVRPGDGS